ncbi:hypothetical protein VUR80DRAFT_9764 [Thermomyces stellatus]
MVAGTSTGWLRGRSAMKPSLGTLTAISKWPSLVRMPSMMGTTRQYSPRGEYWRVVPIIEGILTNDGHFEMAVNVPNDGFIADLPRNQPVEVPATIDAGGVHGIALERYPKAFAGLLRLQVAVNDLTTEAVLTRSKKAALQALLVDPVVDNVHAAEELLDTMISLQSKWLGYLQ